jgi:hypothetical protein
MATASRLLVPVLETMQHKVAVGDGPRLEPCRFRPGHASHALFGYLIALT